ncbi:MAG: c-type cytochrome [Deltaproteobacteria bacterium]|nr:c-type cytochrome [Deltaproteobacteria bacterium]
MKILLAISTLILGLTLAAGSADANCASCHGASGAGDTPVGAAMKIPPLQGKSADAVSKHVSEAANHAQAKGKLSDDDLAAVSAFVATFK